MRIIIIESSPRPGRFSHTRALTLEAGAICQKMRPGWRVDHVSLWGLHLKACDATGLWYNSDQLIDDDAAPIIDAMLEADGIVLASPNYFANVNATMLNFIEHTVRLAHRQLLSGKGALSLSTSAGPEEDQAAHYLAHILNCYGASVVEPFNIGHPIGVFRFDDSTYGPALRRHVEAFVDAVEHPESYASEVAFGFNMVERMDEHGEYLKRVFRRDYRYLRGITGDEQRGPQHG